MQYATSANEAGEVKYQFTQTIFGRGETSERTFGVINPATDAVFAQAPDASRHQLDRAVAAARRAFRDWSRMSFAERRDCLHRFAGKVREHAAEMAALITREQGKPIAASQHEMAMTAQSLAEGNRELAEAEFSQSRGLMQTAREDVALFLAISEDLRNQKVAEALDRGRQLLARPHADPNAIVALGLTYANAAQLTAAAEAFDQAAKADPSLFSAQLNRGIAYLRMGQLDRAYPALQAACTLLPQSGEASLSLGLAYAMQSRYREAVPFLEKAWQLGDSGVKAGQLLATAYLRIDEPARARKLLESERMQHSPDLATSLLLIDTLHLLHDDEAALPIAQAAAQRFPAQAPAQIAEAQVLVRLGRYKDAIPSFNRALQSGSAPPEARVGLADCLQKTGDHEGALSHYRSVLNEPASAQSASLGAGRSLLALRRFEEAESVLEAASRKYPDDAALHVELSRAYARLGKSSLAETESQAASKLRLAANP